MKFVQTIEESQQSELENGPAECGSDDLSGVIGAVREGADEAKDNAVEECPLHIEKINGPRSTALCSALGGMRGHFTCKTRGEKFLC